MFIILHWSYSQFLSVLIIECSITVECHMMLMNGVMLEGLNNLQTICQIVKKLLLKGGRFISDGL